MIPVTLEEIKLLAPELILLLLATVLLLTRPERGIAVLIGLIAVVLGLSGVILWGPDRTILAGVYAVGMGPAYLKALALIAGGISLIMLNYDRSVDERHLPELIALLLFVVVGAVVLVSARHLLIVYLAFELLSVPAYAMVGSIPGNARSTEGGLKYAVFGAVASGVMLYGFSILYGLTGSLMLDGITAALAQDASLAGSPATTVALALIFGGAMYKVAAAPFHYWCPDAFESSPWSVAGFLSVAPKMGGFGLLVGLTALAAETGAWRNLVSAAAFLSMIFGNLAALRQTNARRMLAYSSIAHAGYMLVAVASGTLAGRFALLFYLTAYLVMNLGAFFIVGIVTQRSQIDEFRGLGKRNAFLAFAMTVFLFSLTGLPPFGGFVGKLLIVSAALRHDQFFLVATLVLTSVVSLYYYARIVRMMYFEAPEQSAGSIPGNIVSESLLAVSLVTVVVLGILWEPFGQIAAKAAGLD